MQMDHKSRKEIILDTLSGLNVDEAIKMSLYGREITFLRKKGFEVTPIPEKTLGTVRALCIVKRIK